MSEFQAMEALLRQQNEFLSQRFDAMDERFDRIEDVGKDLSTRLAAVETQVKITNGQVTTNKAKIEAMSTGPDRPLLTSAQGKLLAKVGSLIVGLGGTLGLIANWVVSNWGHLLPAVLAMVGW